MKLNILFAGLVLAAVNFFFFYANAAVEESASPAEIRAKGAFGFPQEHAKILCDTPELRLSLWNNEEYLYAQAVLWSDNDASLGQTEDRREIGDWSQLMLNVKGEGKRTPQVDRNYMLNPWPHLPGLRYSICFGEGATSTIMSDSKGRGAVRYLAGPDGKKTRVDCFLLPMAEISSKPGDKIRLCYWGFSPKPALTLNSTDYKSSGNTYYGHNIPVAKYQDYLLTQGGEVDTTKVPEGRNDISLSHRKNVKVPEVGQPAPEISAQEWINLKAPVTLAKLRGKVVLLEFWATWCGPCVQGIPHLNELQKKYAHQEFQLLSFVEEGHQTMDRFLKRTSVEYPIGLESTSLEDYGISGIPHAFVLDRAGKIVWHGHPAGPELEQALETFLKTRNSN